MSTYLLTWNPDKWDWNTLDEDVTRIKKRGFLNGQWSCGLNKGIQKGDRLFLLRQGVEPKGIFASGTATSKVFQEHHWDPTHAQAGKMANYVKLRFDEILDPFDQILTRQDLVIGPLSQMHWDVQMSGIRIPDEIAGILETEWTALKTLTSSINEFEPHAVEGMITETVTYARGRSDALRRQALVKADGVCAVCAVDYKSILNGKGVQVLQVHHLKQIASSDAPRLTKLSELAVVCANCHMLIHSNPRMAIPIEKLRSELKR